MTDSVWVTPGYPWAGHPVGGVFYQTQARALARLDLDVTVASPTPWAPWPLTRAQARWAEYASSPRSELDDGVVVVRPRYPAIPGEPRWAAPDRQIAGAVWRVRDAWAGARLIHGHSAVTGLGAWRLSRRTGLPLILTFHGSDLNVWPDRDPHRVADLRHAIRDARLVIAVSPALAARVESIADVPALVLPLGSDHRSLAVMAMPKDEARAALGLVDDRVIVLFVGNLLASKGVRELADAILMLEDRFIGVFVGAGPESGYGTDRPGAIERLRYPGPRPHADVARYMSAADVLVLPSHREGLPSVLVEAGSLGLPVIASPVGGIPDLLSGGRGTLLEDPTAESIVRALAAFELGRPAADKSAARLRSHVLAEHDVDTNAARLLEHYRAIGWE